ncbi:nitrate reductase molybdenum cofactor assembly chaperone [Salinisphaera orenii]|uniref:nitrate reductase molybdenum cofactor assembly chaperone n=1 Tax=Salinisphaera orenii TaxID=856731 RepID=UPI000DBE2259
MTAAPANTLARSLSALARLLDYPDAELQAHADELAEAVAALDVLPADEADSVRAFVAELGSMKLLDAQAEWIEIFDRGRKVSLHVFEHVYGESRDRGPAMIELIHAYQQHGFDPVGGELPDFLPVLLEFCSQLPEADARAWLVEAGQVLQTIHVRLAERETGYATAFNVLLRLLGIEPNPARLTDMAGNEQRDDSKAAIDRVWDEAPVTFGPSEAQTADGATRQQPAEPEPGKSASSHNSAETVSESARGG